MTKKKVFTAANPKKPFVKPTVMTPETFAKLEIAFSYGASIIEACAHADIGRSSFYDWYAKNPNYSHKINELRMKPVLGARKCYIDSVKSDPKTALEYLADKRGGEFSRLAARGRHANQHDPENIGKAIGAAASVVFGASPSPFIAGAGKASEEQQEASGEPPVRFEDPDAVENALWLPRVKLDKRGSKKMIATSGKRNKSIQRAGKNQKKR